MPLPPGTLPTPHESDRGNDDWIPFKDQVQFGAADFLFHCNQMSAGDINFIMGLWAASLAVHDDSPPFKNAKDMYNTIDATPLGSVSIYSAPKCSEGRKGCILYESNTLEQSQTSRMGAKTERFFNPKYQPKPVGEYKMSCDSQQEGAEQHMAVKWRTPMHKERGGCLPIIGALQAALYSM